MYTVAWTLKKRVENARCFPSSSAKDADEAQIGHGGDGWNVKGSGRTFAQKRSKRRGIFDWGWGMWSRWSRSSPSEGGNLGLDAIEVSHAKGENSELSWRR